MSIGHGGDCPRAGDCSESSKAAYTLDIPGISAMKHYNPRTITPNPDQFHQLVQDKISPRGQHSLAYKAVLNLFRQAEALFHTLDFYTTESRTLFKDSGQYLTPQQEQDEMALVAHCVAQLVTPTIHDFVHQDKAITEEERLVLNMALDTFRATAEANCSELGTPQWITTQG